MSDLLIHHVHIAAESGIFFGWALLRQGRIAALGTHESLPTEEDVEQIDGGGNHLLPGGIDPHVHIRYPGGAHRETFLTGTQAAAAGGATTIIEHPISTPPQYSKAILDRRIEALRDQALVDVAFLGAAGGDHLEEIAPLGKSGIVGYKTFLHQAPEGREKEFEGLTSKDNHQLFQVLDRIAGTGLLAAAHGEDNDLVSGSIASLRREGRTFPRAHCLSRPPLVETLAVERLIRLAREAGARLYLVHISTAEAVEMALKARAEGQEIYIETCPHYLYLSEKALDEHGAYAKCNPALRSEEEVARLWKYVQDGSIDTVGSDHAPYTVAEKAQSPDDIFVAPAGFPGLETRLPLMLTAVHDGRITLRRAVDLLGGNAGRIFGLGGKGTIRPGADADLILVNLRESFVVRPEEMFTQARDIALPFRGKRLYGRIKKTFLRGHLLFDEGRIVADGGWGRWITGRPS